MTDIDMVMDQVVPRIGQALDELKLLFNVSYSHVSIRCQPGEEIDALSARIITGCERKEYPAIIDWGVVDKLTPREIAAFLIGFGMGKHEFK